MTEPATYFFCGVGGSGMAPLALIMRARGHRVEGSDRALDQARIAAKFDYLRSQGIGLHPQDGSGVTDAGQIVVASAAVEDTVPDMVAARAVGATVQRRADLLSGLFNAAPNRIGIAGTSGKSTITAMLAWILDRAGLDPTVINGADMLNYVTEETPFASARIGGPEVLAAEVDESDGSIAFYEPTVAVVSNISLDHKSLEELRDLFGGFLARAETAVVNLDNDEVRQLVTERREGVISYGVNDARGDYHAADILHRTGGVSFTVVDHGREGYAVELATPGLHNVSNALAAMAAARALGVEAQTAAAALCDFKGVRRRMETVGEAGGVTVIDDFAHNPDKIAASLATLGLAPGRLLVMFQPHGYGPIGLMRAELAKAFAEGLAPDDVLVMPEPAYFGGTTDRSVGSRELAGDLRALGVEAQAFPNREQCGDRLLSLAQPGDRIVIMGARDDTLSVFARDLLGRLG